MINTRVQGLTIGASFAAHALLAAALWPIASPSPAERPVDAIAAASPSPTNDLIALELPSAGPASWLTEAAANSAESVDSPNSANSTGVPPHVTAGAQVARLDTGAAGHGGEATVPDAALNLADEDEKMRASPDLMNRLDRDQLQRLRASRRRSSWEDRRSTTHPAELSLVLMGVGHVFERRAIAADDPSRGALQSPPSSVRGGTLGFAMDARGQANASTGAERKGSLVSAPGVGLSDGRLGRDQRSAAPIASARPAVVLGPVAVPASERARPNDDVDGEQEVATVVQSLVHASSAGGSPGEGKGGSEGGGDPGWGGLRSTGSAASPLGAGSGDVFDYWTNDPRFVPYFRKIHAKIDPLWADAFPKAALFDLKQGTVILEFTIFADGSVSVAWPPLRPSGVDAFDRNCADAIRRAAPFPPLPPQLAVTALRVRAPFVANNPVVK